MSFEVLSNGKLVGRPDGVVFEWCEELSLLFVSMNRTSIWVFRVNGERIYSINNKAAVMALTFLDHGTLFAISGVDNVIKVYDSNTGRLLGVVGGVSFKGITSMRWVEIGALEPATPFHTDILSQMPKLHELEGDLALTAPLNVLVVLDAEGVYFNFNHVFTIASTAPPDMDLVKHIGSLSVSNTMLLTNKGEIVRLCLEGSENEVYDLKKTVGWCCQLLRLHQVAQEQLVVMANEVKAFVSLFDRYLGNMENPEQLYHILLTNRVPLEARDYWFNMLGERGLKRLKKQGDMAYETVRNKLFLLTTLLDRMVIIMSQMKGLSTWRRGEDSLGLDNITRLMEYPQQLIKNLYEMLHQCNKEQELFTSFLKWIKTVIIDGNEGPGVDYLTLVEYFNEGLYKSTTSKYFEMDDLEVMKSETTFNLLAYSESFLSDLRDKLLNQVSHAYTEKLHYTAPVPLEIEIIDPDFVLTSTWNDEFGYITVINGTSLTILQLLLTGALEIKRKVIPINFTLVDQKLDARYLYILYEMEGMYKLEVIDIREALSLPEDDLENIPRICIDQVQLITKPEMIAVNSELCGILDVNRQNYVFLRRNQQLGV